MGLNRGVESAWWALRIGLALIAFLAGLDKFFNILTDWSMYVSPLANGYCRSPFLPFWGWSACSKCWSALPCSRRGHGSARTSRWSGSSGSASTWC